MKHFTWAVIFFPLLWLVLISGIYQDFEKYPTIILTTVVVFIVILVIWDIYKRRINKALLISGVDTLSDYQQDFCDYKLITESLERHQCPHCQSYRMVSLSWFNSKVQKTINSDNFNEADFVGCLKCETAYISQTKKLNSENWLWAIFFVFILLLIINYQCLIYLVALDEATKETLVMIHIICGFNFIQSLVELQDKNPFQTTYSKLN